MDGVVVAASIAFLVVIALVIIYLSIRVVQQYEQMVVFRLGRTGPELVRGPGIQFLIPIADRPVKVDTREQLGFFAERSNCSRSKNSARRRHRTSGCANGARSISP